MAIVVNASEMVGLPHEAHEPETPTKEREDDGISERSTDCSSPTVAEEEEESAIACGDALPWKAPSVATLFLVDWDDTIMPTSWLHCVGALSDPASATQHWGQLAVVAESVCRTFAMLNQLGQIVIVTNAEEGWVQQSTVLFMPGLLSWLWGVQVVSARAHFEKQLPNEPVEWKRLAFESIIGSFRKRLPDEKQVNVVSVGDLEVEQAALRKATVDAPACWGKALKLQEHPNLKQLVHEHRLLQNSIRWVVAEPRDLDLSCKDGCGACA